MQIKTILHKSIYKPEKMVNFVEPQIALTGRSNVGKSTLINRLVGRRQLAKISSTPGKTKSINFYWLPKLSFYLVDLPGYGYAKSSKKEREQWAKVVESYFHKNKSIKGVITILDSRLTPQKLDLELIDYLTNKDFFIIPVLTKIDKCKMAQKNHIKKVWEDILTHKNEPILFSAKTGEGKEAIWHIIKKVIGVCEA